MIAPARVSSVNQSESSRCVHRLHTHLHRRLCKYTFAFSCHLFFWCCRCKSLLLPSKIGVGALVTVLPLLLQLLLPLLLDLHRPHAWLRQRLLVLPTRP